MPGASTVWDLQFKQEFPGTSTVGDLYVTHVPSGCTSIRIIKRQDMNINAYTGYVC